MAEIEQERATRHRVRRNTENIYFTITEKGIMFHAAHESDLARQNDYTAINTICRLISKLRGAGIEWAEIYRQMDAGSMGNGRTWPGIVAQVIRDEGYVR